MYEGGKQRRAVMGFYVNRGVSWQVGNSPVCSFIKSDLKAAPGIHLQGQSEGSWRED